MCTACTNYLLGIGKDIPKLLNHLNDTYIREDTNLPPFLSSSPPREEGQDSPVLGFPELFVFGEQ